MTLDEFADLDALPPAAHALFGENLFDSLRWYRTVVSAGLPATARPVFVTVSRGHGAVAVFPMMVLGKRASTLATPYTCRWRPLLAPDMSALERQAVWQKFAAWCRGFPSVRLEAMDRADAAAISAGVRSAGLLALQFDHFGNRHDAVPQGWAAYLAARPGHVREAVRRRGRRLMRDGGSFTIHATPDGIEDAVAAYESVYARSWKTAEPFPDFNQTLIRACARDGSLRLGVLKHRGEAVATQFWVTHGGWAGVLKLAHIESAKALSPGTVLTALMIEALLTRDFVTELDFGRGDDGYKASWAGLRRQRVGLMLANTRRPAGLAIIIKHWAGRLARSLTRARQGGAMGE